MSLYTLDIQLPREQTGGSLEIFQQDQFRGLEIISSNIMYTDMASAYYRLEVLATNLNKDQIKNLLEESSPGIHFKIREDLSFYEKSLIEISPRHGMEFRKSFMMTAPVTLEAARENLLPARENLKNLKLTGQRLGIFSDGNDLEKPHQVILDLERDSFLISRYTGIQPFPLWMDSKNEEVMIRTLSTLAPNFFALRLSGLDRRTSMDLHERIEENLEIPLINVEYVETPTLMAAVLRNAARHHKMELADKNAAVIGLNTAGHGMSRLLFGMGLKKVFGIDADTRQLSRFERAGGIATSMEHIYDTADFIVISPDYEVRLDESRFHEDQLVVSFTPNALNLEKLDSTILKHTFQGRPPHPIFILPGLIGAVQKHALKHLSLEHQLRFMETLATKSESGQFLPVPSADLIRNQIDSLS